MIADVCHPAVIQLLWLQSRGRRRRVWGRFCQLRRLILSAIACVLAVVWLGNAAMTIWLRETASPQTLRAMLSLGLVLYAGWHVTKAAFFRPESPFEWSPAERELLIAMPLRSRDLVAYQLASVTVTTLVKAALFTFLLYPDLRSVPMGLIGLVLVMMVLEMLRMAIDIVAWGMGRSAFHAYRAAVVAALVATGFAIGALLLQAGPTGAQLRADAGPRQLLLDIVVQLNHSEFGYAALPFQPFIDLILAERMTVVNAVLVAAAAAAVTLLAAAVVGLYAVTSRRIARREQREYRSIAAAGELVDAPLPSSRRPAVRGRLNLRLRAIPRWGGAGALAWRQLIGVRHYWGSLSTAMIAPAVLACFPLFAIEDPNVAFLSTTGTLAFYTFLLLPTALRFDFRRDLEHLATLKALPITPVAAAIGQTLAPVLMATLFQCGVLAFAVVARSLPPHRWLMAMLVMIPLNALVFVLDNLIFLLYPYRMRQEGLEVFLRTMLTFTGKGLLFVAGLAAMSACGFAAAPLTHRISHWTGLAMNAYVVFTGGMIAASSLLAAIALYALCWTYRRLNPIEDVPR